MASAACPVVRPVALRPGTQPSEARLRLAEARRDEAVIGINDAPDEAALLAWQMRWNEADEAARAAREELVVQSQAREDAAKDVSVPGLPGHR
jgi:hypothetical protein